LVETKFNPPPQWPIPNGWTPSADWVPDPSWPPAPPGWQFWVSDEPRDEALAYAERPQEVPSGRPWWKPTKGVVFGSVAFAVVVTLGFVVLLGISPLAGINTQPEIKPLPPTDNGSSGPTVRPDWGHTPLYINFAAWNGFGDVEATFSNDNESVRLDTHDTTDTWRTKWSGLISPMTTGCAMRIVGRVRDISHIVGVPGGFGIGIGTLGSGNRDDAELAGMAFQFDFGQRGYRSAVYPSDSDTGLVAATLDHEWHQVDVVFNKDSRTLSVDGRTVATTPVRNQCGQPFIRVWAGAAEFADFTVTPLG
jgi:hypothetical protein